jgi:hypothetical protein
MHKYLVTLVFIFWILLHFYFLQLNNILKIPDSFSYLQMSYYLESFDIRWFWTWWFGFLYSLPIAIANFLIGNYFLSFYLVNLLLFIISWILLYQIWKRYLTKPYNILLLMIFFLSSTLIHYNINILSENLYMPIFLWFILFLCRHVDNISLKDDKKWNKKNISYLNTKKTIMFSIILW